MDIYGDDAEITDIHMFQRVVGMFERQRRFQRIITYGLLGMEFEEDLDDTADDDDDDSWAHGRNNNFHRYPRRSPLHYYSSVDELPSLPPVTDRAKENDTERRGRLVQETKQSKAKAEKKRLKKQKQRRRKQLEKLEREKRNPTKKEEKTDREQSKAEESEASNDKTEDDTNSSVKQSAAAKDTGSSSCSEAESSDEDSDSNDDSCDSEELDMTSTFVTKAALIANRKSAQRPKQERKEKKKTVIKEVKTVPDKPNEDPEPEKKEPAAPSTPTLEENIKISTELAVIGNKFAGSGDFNMAVKYFTDAIKYNPTEFKLFGNRSFCFEKMREYEKALTDAELCLNINPGWVKGLFRKGRALAGLKRYEEAAQSFREVLQLDSSYAEAAQELMRVQITQLMEYGFTREESSNALIIHGTVKKALEVLYKLHGRPGAVQSVSLSPAQVVNATGVSPVLRANTNSGPNAASAAAAPRPPQSHVAPKTSFMNKPLGPVHNMSNVLSQQNPVHNQATKHGNENGQKPTELFPVWVGNLFYPVEESVLTNVFKEAGVVYSVKILSVKRCAFVNYTKQEHCDEAIRRFHGYELEGNKIAVRYPDRIPQGIGISKSALKADENVRQNAVGSRRPIRTYRQADSYNN